MIPHTKAELSNCKRDQLTHLGPVFAIWLITEKICPPLLYQFSSVAQSCLTLYDLMDCSTPGLPVHHQLPELTQAHVHRVGDAIQPSHPLSSPSPLTFNLPASGSFPMSQFFTSGSQSIKSFSFSISPSNENSGLISFRMNWLDLLAALLHLTQQSDSL